MSSTPTRPVITSMPQAPKKVSKLSNEDVRSPKQKKIKTSVSSVVRVLF